MKRILFVTIMLAALSSTSLASETKPLTWRTWDAGLREAGGAKRPILVDVYTNWCGWCKRMDREVYSRADIQDYLSRRFVLIKLNAEAPDAAAYEGQVYTSRSLAARFRVSGFPTTIFLRPGGEHVANVPGYIPAERFLLLLHYIGDGHLDRGVPFDDYVKTASAAPEDRK